MDIFATITAGRRSGRLFVNPIRRRVKLPDSTPRPHFGPPLRHNTARTTPNKQWIASRQAPLHITAMAPCIKPAEETAPRMHKVTVEQSKPCSIPP